MPMTARRLALIGLLVTLPVKTSAIVDVSDIITTERLVGTWFQMGPGADLVVPSSVVIKVLSGPFAHGPIYSGIVRCGNPQVCPGRRADLRDVTVVRRTPTGLDSLLYDFGANATFETGITCHFSGVTLDSGVSALASLFTCVTPGGSAASFGEVHVRLRGRPTSRDTNQ